MQPWMSLCVERGGHTHGVQHGEQQESRQDRHKCVCVCEEGGVRSKGQGGCVRDNGVKGCSKTSVCVHVCVWSWFAARQ